MMRPTRRGVAKVATDADVEANMFEHVEGRLSRLEIAMSDMQSTTHGSRAGSGYTSPGGTERFWWPCSGRTSEGQGLPIPLQALEATEAAMQRRVSALNSLLDEQLARPELGSLQPCQDDAEQRLHDDVDGLCEELRLEAEVLLRAERRLAAEPSPEAWASRWALQRLEIGTRLAVSEAVIKQRLCRIERALLPLLADEPRSTAGYPIAIDPQDSASKARMCESCAEPRREFPVAYPYAVPASACSLGPTSRTSLDGTGFSVPSMLRRCEP